MLKVKVLRAFLCICSIVAAGCAHEVSRPDTYTTKQFSAPVGVRLEVNTGDAFYVSGTYIDGERIVVPEALDMMIPGAMFIPFPVHIGAGHLEMTSSTSSWKYFCAEEGKATASFPGLGSVIRRGDCVGIRVSTDGKTKEWVVDNSIYNRQSTVWTRSMSSEDADRYVVQKSPLPYKVQVLKRLIFDGYYGGQLHFTWEETTAKGRDSRQFVFDFQKDQAKVLGVKGNQFKVFSADDVKLGYEWLKFD